MSNEERDMILGMVAENKITSAEAADLLDALADVEREDGETNREERFSNTHHRDREARRAERDVRRRERDLEREIRHRDREHRRTPRSGRTLMIHIRDGEDTRTHVNIPLGMALAAGKFIPQRARAYFDDYGIDLTDLLDSVANNLGQSGDIVNIREGDKSIRVAIEGIDQPTPSAPSQPTSPMAPAEPMPPEAPEAPEPPEPPSTPMG